FEDMDVRIQQVYQERMAKVQKEIEEKKRKLEEQQMALLQAENQDDEDFDDDEDQDYSYGEQEENIAGSEGGSIQPDERGSYILRTPDVVDEAGESDVGSELEK
ncbi:hypothetical protein HDU76_003505, partial [Blyttiomyces sp. JEL0837]